MRIHTSHTRDAAVRRLHLLSRGVLAGSVVLTGVFAETAKSAFHGKTVNAAATARARASRAHGGKAGKDPAKPLQAPASAPKSTGEGASTSSPAQSAPSPGGPVAEPSQSDPSTEAPAPSTPAPAQESAPAQEATPAPEASSSAPAGEPTPAPESAPPAEESAPVVSGGS